jgi:hypothetical protein
MNHKKQNGASDADLARADKSAESDSSVWDGDDVVIFSYCRAQAIEDGVLVDASKLAAEAGFRYPVALTYAAWVECVRVNPCDKCQDECGRLWDVLTCLRLAARNESGSSVKFSVLVKRDSKMVRVQLKSICGPGDNHEPVVTVMLPEED